MLSYFYDQCYENVDNCQFHEYKDFALANNTEVLNSTELSVNEFTDRWSEIVAKEFNLDENVLKSLYTDDDVYESANEIVDSWKRATSNGIVTTPSAKINGVLLNPLPSTVEEW